jgi:hypothetical protein
MIWRSRSVSAAYRSRSSTTIDAPRASDPVTLDPRANRIEQVLLVERLGQELYRPSLHRPYAHRNIPMTGDKNHWQSDSGSRELLLKHQTAHPRQSDVEHETAENVLRVAVQELLRRGE